MSGDVLTSYTVYGVIASAAFQQCTEAAAYVNRTYPESFAVVVQRDVPRDFAERRARWAAAGHLTAEQAESDVLVHNTSLDQFLTAKSFLAAVTASTNYHTDTSVSVAGNHDSYSARAQQSWLDFLASRNRQYCWFDVTIDGAKVGTIWFELFSGVAPLTCKNFCALCRGVSVDVPASSSSSSSVSPSTAPTTTAYQRVQFLHYAATNELDEPQIRRVWTGDGRDGRGGRHPRSGGEAQPVTDGEDYHCGLWRTGSFGITGGMQPRQPTTTTKRKRNCSHDCICDEV